VKTLLDSSAFAKRYVDEDGSQEVDEICQATSILAISVLCVPEIVSALNRRVREKRLSATEYIAAKSRLSADVADAIVVNLTPSVIARAVFLLETNVLRAMDALHVASALEWGAELFASCDDRQIKAAKRVGLRTRRIGIG
jgi:predicted nucleic acid-binding protein